MKTQAGKVSKGPETHKGRTPRWARALLASVCVGALFAGASARAQDTTLATFTAGDEGWTCINWDGNSSTVKPLWEATGGNTGGFIRAGDVQGDGFWNAPASLLGDWSAGYGATLSYDAFSAYSGWKMNDIYIANSNLTICYWFPTNPPPQWTTFSVKLDASAGWQSGLNYDTVGRLATEAEIRAVLANVTSVRIRQEFAYGTDDSGLDNVRLVRGTGIGPQFGPTELQGGSIILTVRELRPSQTYQVRHKPGLSATATWQFAFSFTATNSTQVFSIPATNTSMFYRVETP